VLGSKLQFRTVLVVAARFKIVIPNLVNERALFLGFPFAPAFSVNGQSARAGAPKHAPILRVLGWE
jgi:hypothetical protein